MEQLYAQIQIGEQVARLLCNTAGKDLGVTVDRKWNRGQQYNIAEKS